MSWKVKNLLEKQLICWIKVNWEPFCFIWMYNWDTQHSLQGLVATVTSAPPGHRIPTTPAWIHAAPAIKFQKWNQYSELILMWPKLMQKEQFFLQCFPFKLLEVLHLLYVLRWVWGYIVYVYVHVYVLNAFVTFMK